MASITLWPGGGEKRTTAQPDPKVKKALERQVEALGYRGKWYSGPFGRWANFWKKLSDMSNVTAEVRRLETAIMTPDRSDQGSSREQPGT